ncbi:MAG TPA: DUF4164 family protein [Hellea balneolensis]|uniref:DUF4164 family protein n=1 Tax=Hellea balneolensis TaxID=287478 RepID=A0A7V5U1C4_9PROT|nr:DUF4164 family protein [Hellea balneolensis]
MTETSSTLTMQQAAERLQSALGKLENALEPMIARVGELETRLEKVKTIDADRAKLASEVDELKAQNQSLREREKEFARLAAETTRELETVIAEVQTALGENGSGA